VADAEKWVTAYIGIGSNLNDPVYQVRAALEALQRLPDTQSIKASSLYRNPPMGPAEQPEYVNAVASALTCLTPAALLAALLELEQQAGRDRERQQHWGPRVLDLDLLVYGELEIDEPGLQVPHPGISERTFVLFPLREIAAGLEIPGQGRVAELAALLDDADLHRIA
jgi:2-amino-4-hydroxy-6-hydroxymethyldihydropteridine diphosphokinase